jgi:hypothetical protein
LDNKFQLRLLVIDDSVHVIGLPLTQHSHSAGYTLITDGSIFSKILRVQSVFAVQMTKWSSWIQNVLKHLFM